MNLKRKDFLIVNIILASLPLVFIGWQWKKLPPEIPLFYSRPWGEEQLADKKFLFLLPTFALTSLFINEIVAKLTGKFYASLLNLTSRIISLAVAILCLVASYQIVFLLAR